MRNASIAPPRKSMAKETNSALPERGHLRVKDGAKNPKPDKHSNNVCERMLGKGAVVGAISEEGNDARGASL